MTGEPNNRTRRDDEIDLAPYIAAVSRRRYFIAVATLACGAAMFLVSALSAPTFEARAQLLVTSPRGADQAGAPMGVDTFVALVENPAVVGQAIQEARAKNASAGGAAVVLDRLPNTEVVNVTVRSSDGTFAAAVANAVTEKAVTLAGQLADREIESTRSGIKAQLDRSREHLDEAEKQLAAVKKAGQGNDDGRLQAEADVAREVYMDAATRYEQAALDVTARSLRVQIIARAVPPAAPVSPRTVRLTLVGLLAGLALSLAAVVGAVALRQASAR